MAKAWPSHKRRNENQEKKDAITKQPRYWALKARHMFAICFLHNL